MNYLTSESSMFSYQTAHAVAMLLVVLVGRIIQGDDQIPVHPRNPLMRAAVYKTAHIWSAPRLQRVNFRDVQDWVSCKHISGLSLGAVVSRALMGSAHTRLIKLTVSKTKAQYRLLACRSDLSCHHFYFTPRNRWRLLPPKKLFVSRRAPSQ